jgi:hypothetical protein
MSPPTVLLDTDSAVKQQTNRQITKVVTSQKEYPGCSRGYRYGSFEVVENIIGKV